jgi:UDP-glucuronate decarboxylase
VTKKYHWNYWIILIFEMVRHDITEAPYYAGWMKFTSGLSCLMHYQYNPIKTIKTSVMELLMFWVWPKRVKAKSYKPVPLRVYGDPQVHLQTESYWGM